MIQALKDAMLAHSSALGIGPSEWLTIAAKGQRRSAAARARPTATRARASSGCSGSDLADFLAGKITREEALKRIEVRVF